MRRGRAFEIRGRLKNTTDTPIPSWLGVPVVLFSKGADLASVVPRFANPSERSPEFQFKNLIPGTYILRAVVSPAVFDADAAHKAGLVGQTEVTITDANAEVTLPLGTGLEVAATIRGEKTDVAQARPNLIQAANLAAYSALTTEQSEDSTFHIRGLLPEAYRVVMSGLADGNYVKQMRFNGQEITAKDLDLASGDGGELQITISPNAGEVSGVVRNQKGDAVASAAFEMFDNRRAIMTLNTDHNGAFHVGNLAPGDYQLFAWEAAMPEITENPEFRKHFTAATVTIAEKSHEHIDLKLISKDAIDAEAAKLP